MRITKYKTLLNEDKRAELVKDLAFNYPVADNLLNPYAIVKMLADLFQMDRYTEECVVLLAFDTKFKLIGLMEISHGTVDASLVSPREIFQKAMLLNACNIVIIHNHPSGDVTPSHDDYAVKRRLSAAGELIGIPLADFLIIGDKDYFSFSEHKEKNE